MRRYAVAGVATSPALEAFVQSVAGEFERDGFVRVESVDDADFVLNLVDGANPKAFRRKSRGTYSASFYELPSRTRRRAQGELPDARAHARERRAAAGAG